MSNCFYRLRLIPLRFISSGDFSPYGQGFGLPTLVDICSLYGVVYTSNSWFRPGVDGKLLIVNSGYVGY